MGFSFLPLEATLKNHSSFLFNTKFASKQFLNELLRLNIRVEKSYWNVKTNFDKSRQKTGMSKNNVRA